MSVPAPTALPAAAQQLAARLLASRPLAHGQMQVIGLAAPPGSGKSTLAACMVARARQQGLRAATLSLDDVYLPRRQRQQLAARVHPLQATRGPPGSHDLALALSVITTLRNGQACALPRFDKLADERLPATQWPQAGAGLQLLVLEGWMLGVGPQDPAALAMPVNALEREHDADGRWRQWCNQRLAQDYPALWQQIDWLCALQPPDWDCVLGWRIEQEQRLAASQGRSGMDAAAVARFLQHLERVGRHALATLPAIAALCLQLDAQRRVVEG
ncbi:kinase [Stenotrophomonas ginsengisoli]|uniref:kinase n=1 Tax=Stenotrophomonas ginsengisoli TaxID=336566 RepID=UPI00070ED273|nr:kinase [Stenotrophomonas ginsengisoli]